MLKLLYQLLTSTSWTFFLNTGSSSFILLVAVAMFVKRYMTNCLLRLYIFHTTSVHTRRGQLWLIKPQSYSKQVSGWMLLYVCCCNLSGGVVLIVWFTTNVCQDNTIIMYREQAIVKERLRARSPLLIAATVRIFAHMTLGFLVATMPCSEIWSKFMVLYLHGCCQWFHGVRSL